MAIYKNIKPLIAINKEPKKDKEEEIKDNKSSLVFGIISPGEGNTRIG